MISNRIFVAAVAMLAWIAAGAQKRLTMQECIDMAVKNNYGIRAAEGEVEKSQLMQGSAWDLDKTSLSLKQDPTSGGSPDNSLTLSQSFDFPTVYALRRRSLKAETAVAKSRAGLSRKQLSAEVANAYGQMVFVIEKKRILAEQDTIIGKYLHLATVRYMAGEARQLEKLTASRMRSENRMELEKTDAEYRALKQKMRELLNTDEDIAPADEQQKPLTYEEAGSIDFASTAEGEYYSKALDMGNRKVSEAKSGYLPNFSVGLSTQMVFKGWNPYHVDRSRFGKGDFMGFEVGVGLPLFFGSTRAKVKAARKDREITELYGRQSMQRMQTEYDIQKGNYLAARKRMDYYTGEGLAEAREMARIAQVSYENGDIGYVEYIQSLLESVNTRWKYAETVREYNIAVINLRNMVK